MTGGLGRLGSQYVRALAAAGASVAAFDVEGAKSAIVQGLVDAGQRVSTHTVDAADRAAVDAAMAAVGARFGTPTILVNNAGLGSSPADAICGARIHLEGERLLGHGDAATGERARDSH